MARSHAIWVVLDTWDEEIIAAFTVKHELKTWLNKQPAGRNDFFRVWRLQDGMQLTRLVDGKWTTDTPREIPVSEILAS